MTLFLKPCEIGREMTSQNGRKGKAILDEKSPVEEQSGEKTLKWIGHTTHINEILKLHFMLFYKKMTRKYGRKLVIQEDGAKDHHAGVITAYKNPHKIRGWTGLRNHLISLQLRIFGIESERRNTKLATGDKQSPSQASCFIFPSSDKNQSSFFLFPAYLQQCLTLLFPLKAHHLSKYLST